MGELFPGDYDDDDFRADMKLIVSQTNKRYENEISKMVEYNSEDERIVQEKILKIRIFQSAIMVAQ